MNTYGYVGGNPLRYSDSEGLCPWCAVGAVIGGGVNAYSQYRQNGGFNNFNWGSFVASTATGALGGGLGALTKGLTAASSIVANSIGSAAIGASVTTAQNQLTGSCDSVSDAAINGALAGGLGAGIGSAVSNTFASLNRAYYNSLPLSTRLLLGSNAISGFSRPVIVPGSVTVSNAISNTIANLPIYQREAE